MLQTTSLLTPQTWQPLVQFRTPQRSYAQCLHPLASILPSSGGAVPIDTCRLQTLTPVRTICTTSVQTIVKQTTIGITILQTLSEQITIGTPAVQIVTRQITVCTTILQTRSGQITVCTRPVQIIIRQITACSTPLQTLIKGKAVRLLKPDGLQVASSKASTLLSANITR